MPAVGDALKPKKFTFERARAKPAAEPSSSLPSHSDSAPSKSPARAAAVPIAPAAPSKPSEGDGGEKEKRLQHRGLVGARIVLGSEAHAADVSLEELRDCVVVVHAVPRALLIARLTGCTLLCGSVAGAVHARECSSCTLALGCQQLRVHSSTRCRAFVRVRAVGGAVIEDSQELLFSPFPPALALALNLSVSTAGAEPPAGRVQLEATEIEKSSWSDVRDFNWLAADTPSPHWRPLPADEASPPDFPPAPDWTSLLALDSDSHSKS